jgi:hypothetical protein
MTVAALMTDDNVEGRLLAAPVSMPAKAAPYTSASVIIHPF